MPEVLKFPPDWPVDCPPSDAISGPIEVFRILREFPPGPDEFRTAHELGRYKKQCQCKRRGLSVLPHSQAVSHYLATFPDSGKIVVKAMLNYNDGKLIKSPSKNQPEHFTWWPALGVDPAKPFEVCKV